MRTKAGIGALALSILSGYPTHADMTRPIPGAVPRLDTRFVVARSGPRREAVPSGLFPVKSLLSPRLDMAGADPIGLIPGGSPILRSTFVPRRSDPARDEISAPDLPIRLWTRPLMERTLNQAEKSAEISVDFREAILRVEGLYDPTRLDGTGLPTRMMVRAGTASMNNVFADRWSIADNDANVNYRVRYIAYAWQRINVRDCRAFSKRRLAFGGTVLTNLSVSDCARLTNQIPYRDDMITRMPVVAAALDVPAFAAPEPGARLSSHDFWAAQEARMASIRESLRLKRQGVLFVGLRE